MRRTVRVCPTPGCPELTPGGPCPDHARLNSHARGYDRQHRSRRADVADDVLAGRAICWRCGQTIETDEPWDLGHDDVDRSITRGPEHRDRCNRSAAGRASQDRHRG